MSNVVVKFQAPARIRVEKGVAMPTRQGRNKHPCPYPFMDMSVGDSFLIACTNNEHNVLNHINRHKTRFLKENPGPYRFESRRVQGGIRCWRVK